MPIARGFTVASAALVVSAWCAALGSCSDSGTRPSHHGHYGGAAGRPDGGTDATTPIDCSAGDAAVDPDASWSPDTDSTWHPVCWAAPCPIQIADQPKLAVPPLTWQPCGDGPPGCLELVMPIDHKKADWVSPGRVVKWGSGYRVGLGFVYSDYSRRVGLFDVDGTPLAAWSDGGTYCGILVPVPTPTRVWLYSVFIDDNAGATAAYVTAPYEAIGSANASLPIAIGNQGYAATDDLLALWEGDGSTAVVYDRLTGKASHLSPGPGVIGYDLPVPVNHSALLHRYPVPEHAEGWIWNHDTAAIEPLIQPVGQVVPDFQSDGEMLVWIQTPPKSPSDPVFSGGDIWTAPFVTSKAALQASKRRAAPPIGSPNSVAGDGFYAVPEAPDYKVMHVYRLSDMQHWSFSAPPPYRIYGVSYVDSSEVWYVTAWGLYRQQIAALGPGDPPP